ncbi:DNA endonuclease SmrA [Ferrimonas lipolytica]|uniref:DNA endonuclease SmrA n=1 Tax=Ferrimonas lipolytica TaxID=2724191 RepID=A0A6H1UBB4_9GAMM|nr:DNA endonuclease SmrA [Ferrimonas lipolytica]QIZ76334.1 DNA endonuclease SmrA [Ferrimonas lipolytica]
MNHEEQDLFMAEMSDVKPLQHNQVRQRQSEQQLTAAQIARREAAQQDDQQAADQLTLDAVDLVEPEDIIGWTRGGMQHGVYKNLRLGKYAQDARLDLHGLSVEESRRALLQFIVDCQRNNIRSALILHGKGIHSKPFRGILKSYIAKWLPCIAEVLAFHSALAHHGGTGAVYVLMKKSPNEKLENRERHQKK